MMTAALHFVKNGGFLSLLLFLLSVPPIANQALAMDLASKKQFANSLAITTDNGPVTFEIDLASTPEQQEKGLMFRKSLPENYGMLFVHEPPRIVTMWMKNTLIPLDMLFIDANRNIVHIHENAEPESLTHISYPKPVWAVLEIAGGMANKRGINIGQRVYYGMDSIGGSNE